MADYRLLLEAERRGLLSPQQSALLREAQRRGLLEEEQPAEPVITEPKSEDQSFLREVADVPLKVGTGIAQGIRFITDSFGADNPVSQNIRGVENYLEGLLSAQSKQDSQEIARIMQEAEDKGVGAQVVAALDAFTKAPVDVLSQAVGTALPTVVGGLSAGLLRGAAGAVAKKAAAPAIGAVTGAGLTKSTIYDETKNALLEEGVSEEEAERTAVQAQEYGGKNLDQILLGTTLGAVAAGTGFEKALAGKILSRTAAKEGAEEAAKQGVIRGAITEAAPEAAQAAQEQLAANIALQREGFDVPTARGVAGAAALEGIAGGILGGGLGAVSGRPEVEVAPETELPPPPPEAPATQLEPEALQRAQDYMSRVDEGEEKFNWMRGRKLLKEMGVQVPPEAKAADVRQILDSTLGREAAAPKQEPLGVETLIGGAFVPPKVATEVPSGVPTSPAETVAGAVGRGATVPSQRPIAGELTTTEPDLTGVGSAPLPTVSAVRGAEAVEPALTELTASNLNEVATTVEPEAAEPEIKPAFPRPAQLSNAAIGLKELAKTTYSLGTLDRAGYMAVVGELNKEAPDISVVRSKLTQAAKAAGIEVQRAAPKLDLGTRKFMLDKKGDRDALTQIADLMLQNAPSESESLNYAEDYLDPFGVSKETIKSKPGVNARRMAKMLGPQLYGDPSDMGVVTIKEILQNSFDSIKGMIDNGELAKGKIDIDVDPDNRVIEMTDNGRGMTPQLLGTKFLEIAGTGKDAKTPSGGFGIAKMLFLYGNKGIRVTTMRDGKVAEMVTNGEQLFDALENPELAPNILVRAPTEEDLQKFPDGHGTNIALTIPENFNDPTTGEVKDIRMVQYEGSVKPLMRSPLFADIDVSFRNKRYGQYRDSIPIGSSFPYNDYTEFTNVKFPWGNARVYVAPSEETYGENLHVLSNGLYQFSQKVSKDPLDMWSSPVPFQFYVDIKPTVKPEDAGYPFTFNRKDFTEQAKKDYGKIMSYINALYAYQDISNSASSFGSIQYFDSPNELSAPMEVRPTVPPATTTFAGIQQGDNVTVEDGKLFVRGKELPELTPDQLREGIPKADQLKVDPEMIDPNRVMLHDNLKLAGSDQTFSDYMRGAYGSAFDKFMYEVGDVFKDLRNEVVTVLGSDYSGLSQEAVGLSFDKEYRGVSIRVPFSGSFVNPFATRSVNTIKAAYGAFGTMIHELAHFKVRSHNSDFPAEMQLLEYELQAADKKKFDQYQSRLVDAFNKYQDIFEAGWRLVNESGSLEARGDHFKDGSREDAGKPADEGVPRGKRRPSGDRRTRKRVQPSTERGGEPAGERGATAKRGKRDEKAKPAGKKAEPIKIKIKETPEDFKERRVSELNNKFNKNGLIQRIRKYLWGEDAGSRRVDLYERAVKFFQNELRPLKQLEEALRNSKTLIVGLPGFNNAYSLITAAQDKAAFYASTVLKQPMDAAYKAIDSYAKMRGLDTNKALEELDRLRIILHEPERREVMFMLNAPLSTKRRQFVGANGKKMRISPAEIRQAILKQLVTKTDLASNGTAKALGNTLRQLVMDKTNLDPLGDSPIAEPNKPLSTDINSATYNVLGGYTPEFIQQLRDDFARLGPRAQAAAEAALKAVNDVQDKTKDLNRKAKYWSQPVDNIVAFYNFQNYAPLKGRPEKGEAAKLDINDRRVSGEFAEAAQAMEGRQSEAENSILQSFSDAYYAAARAGREGVTDAVKNMIEQGHIKGKLVGKITMADRYLNRDFSFAPYKGENKIFHYDNDGNIEVYQIAPQDYVILHAIRRPYQESHWATKAGNAITGFFGQMHTRFNPSFAPLNFPRDIITNTLNIAGEYGVGDARKYFVDALLRNVMRGGLYKSGRVSNLIEKGDLAKVKELAEKDPFINDTLEWIQYGGRTAYQQSYSIGAQAEALDNSLNEKGVVAATKRGLQQVVAAMDVYNDAFEFTNRVAAYAMARDKARAQMKQAFVEKNKRQPNAQEMKQIEEAAKIEGASFAKNLANFRLVGDAGREAGALFMFFRTASTGAVRAIDTIMPALVSYETALSKAPESTRKNPEVAKQFRQTYEARKNRARWAMFITAAAGAWLYEMALAGADDDDQGRNRVATDDMARWTRYARLPVLGEDTFLQIPWGFGISAFGAFGAQMASLARGNVAAKDVAANTINIGFDSFLPIPKSNINVFDNFTGFLVDSVTPSALRPFVEYAMNTDNLGNEIYNSRQSRYSDVYTGGTNIPEFYKKLAKDYFEMTGYEVSPNTIYFWTSNYADALGRVATSAYDLRMFAANEREFRSVDDLDKVVPFIDSFIGTKSNYDARQYASVEEQVQKKQRLLNTLKFRPDDYAAYLETNPNDEEIVDYYERAIQGDLKKLREQANFIRNTSELSTQQKRDLLKENTRMQNLAKRNLIDSFQIYYGIEPK